MLAHGAAVPQPLQIEAETARTGPRLVLIGGRPRWGVVAFTLPASGLAAATGG
jgi:hypothetical protein